MRGEREAVMAGLRAGITRSDATPNTPSTASSSTVRNPMSYNRMHSNDSDKESSRASD